MMKITEEQAKGQMSPYGKYQIRDGHHRWTAAKNAGLEKIPVRVVKP
jgi:ParB-like chromosome segregation protein Spo0J